MNNISNSEISEADVNENINPDNTPSALFKGLSHIKNFLFIKNSGTSYKKTAFIYGYYCMNLGDDLFLETVIKRYPNVLFLVLNTDAYYDFFKKFKNVKFYSYENQFVKEFNSFGHKIGVHDIFEHLLLLKTDAVVHIGGAIYQETPDYLDDYNIRKRRSGFKKRFFSISSNFGPYHSDDFYLKWKKMFKRSYDICFRDKYSCELFRDLRSVRYAPDVLFSFKGEPVNTVPGSVAISVINPFLEVRKIDNAQANAYKNAIINTVISLAERKRAVNLLGFCTCEKDDEFIEEVLKAIPDTAKKFLNVLNYCFDNRDRMIEILASSEYILGTRLHSIILAIAMNKKVLPVVYGDKVSNILTDVGFTGKSVTLGDLADYQNTGLTELIDQTSVFDKSHLEDSADRQFAKLDKILKRS